MTLRISRHAVCTVVLALATFASATVAAAASCQRSSAASVPAVVELYTSEGCSSCPPADKWLSTLKGKDDVIAMAFHVDYWDRLGWKDRFDSPAYSERQNQEQVRRGADYSYTPQVLLDGKDLKTWRFGRTVSGSRKQPAATVAIEMMRSGNHYVATVTPGANAPTRLAAYWTVTEDGHASAVKAGENSGATLRHDFVVREYLPVAPWTARNAARTLEFAPGIAVDAAHPRAINLVVVDVRTGEPVQAVRVAC